MGEVLSASAKVVMALKEGILAGDFPVGALLPPEDRLVRRFEVSRVSLREGIKQLEALGWLRIERGTGTRVVEPDFSAIGHTLDFLARFELLRFEHVHQLRRVVEVDAVRGVARVADAELVAELRAANAVIRDHLAEPVGYVDADVAFHDRLLRACPNPLYPRLMDGFRSYLLLSRRMSYRGPASTEAAIAAHDRIIEAIAAGDADAAGTAMAEHLATTTSQLELEGS